MAGSETYTPTILDYLNEDCWRAVLKHVPVRDIIISERVSRSWQRAMLGYLRGVRIRIESRGFRVTGEFYNFRSIMRWDIPEHSFERWTHKLGTSVVAIYCVSEEILKIISKNCPNVEALILCDPEGKLLQSNYNNNFKRLKKLSFVRCYYASDQCIIKFMSSKALEEVKISSNKILTGQCLDYINSKNLKSLTLDSCRSLEAHHFLATIQLFSELTKLELVDLPIELYDHIPLLLDNLPKLEFLSIVESELYFVDVGDYYKSVCKLMSLKFLRLHVQNITEEDLDDVTRCCKDLQSLEIKNSFLSDFNFTAQCLSKICLNAGARLTALGLTHCNELTDYDILACIRACPNLTLLDVSNCKELTPMLLALAAAALREMHVRKRLRLFVNETSMEHYFGMDFKQLIIDRCMCLHKIGC